MLMGGWDNVAHFSMVHMIRRFGAVVSALPPPTPGATWQFASYPQGFHAVAAGVVELLIGPDDTWLGPELVAYTQAMALVVIGVATTVVAGFCALPAVRRRPVLGAAGRGVRLRRVPPRAGSLAIGGGIANFAVACGVGRRRRAARGARRPRGLAAHARRDRRCGRRRRDHLGAAARAGRARAPRAAPAAAAQSVGGVPRPRRGVAGIVVAAVVVGLAHTAAVLSQVQAANPLTIDGGRVPIDVGLLVAAGLAIVGMGVALVRRHPRVAGLMAMPIVATATAAWLIQLQVAANGEITYYGLKFLLGAQVVLFAVAGGAGRRTCSSGAGRSPPGTRSRRARVRDRGAGVDQVFGLTPTGLAPGIAAEAPGVTNA